MLGSDQAKGFEMLGLACANGFEKIGLAWAKGFEMLGLAWANGINSQRIMREMMGKKGLRPAFSPKKEAFKQKEIGVRSSPFSTKYNVHCALMEINNGELTKED